MSANLIREFSESSQLAGGNADYVEQVYEAWLADPGTVPAEWDAYFKTFKGREAGDVPHSSAIARIEAAQKQRRGA
ncbi:2-oxoglutarate dehydrogenase E1 subunit family protein, partial [Luteibacter yeojuensis]